MWTYFVTAVTLVPMLFHSIVGCCWHHEHATCSAAHCHRGHADNSTESSCCDGHYAHPLASEDDPQSPVPHEPCRESKCQYIVVPSLKVTDSFDAHAGFNSLVMEWSSSAEVVVVTSRDSLPDRSDPVPGDSATRRAALQVWRI